MTQLVRVARTRPGDGFSLINGVVFAPSETPGRLLSEPIPLEEAERLFLACPGYSLAEALDPEPPTAPFAPRPATRRSRGPTP